MFVYVSLSVIAIPMSLEPSNLAW